jgi:energy-coupling factor transport system ATP-binding protein
MIKRIKHSSKPILKVSNLKFSYPEQSEPILNGIDLKLYPQEIRIIVGPSGCGKSTLASAICGFIPNSIEGALEGSIKVAGKFNQHRNIYQIARDVSLVQQDTDAQLCTTDVFHELAFALENFKVPVKDIINRVHGVLNDLGIEHLKDRSLHTLSGGEKQKVAIASMLVLKPKILVFDEPTANLDPKATKEFVRMINELRRKTNIAILIVDHNPAQYYTIADHILVLRDGFIEHILSKHQFKKFNLEYYSPVFNKNKNNLPYSEFSNKDPKNDIESSEISSINKINNFNNVNNKNIIKNRDVDVYKNNRNKNYEIKENGKDLVHINKINFSYGRNRVLTDVSFSIKKGEFIAIMGDNGSGKTTLIQNIINLITPTKGLIIYNFNGSKLNNRSTKTHELAKDIGFVFQNPNHMIFGNNVWEEVMLGPNNLFKDPKFAEKNARDLLKLGHLLKYNNVHPLLLSHGEKRRVNLASILCYNPEIVMLDEPFIGQDPENISKILDYLLKMVNNGKTIIIVTHRVDIVKNYCTRLLFLKEGKLILDEEPELGFKILKRKGEHSYLPSDFFNTLPGGLRDGTIP